MSDLHGNYKEYTKMLELIEIIYSDDVYKDYKIVCGHNMVHTIERNMTDIKIIHRKGHIFIDCGCGAIKGHTKLGCLRLDDLKEYYV